MNIYQPILPQGESFSSRVLKTLSEQDAKKQRSNEMLQETMRTQAATGQLSDMVNQQLNDAIEQASKQRLLGVDQYAVMNQAVPEFYKNKSALTTLQQAHAAEMEALKADEDVEWNPKLAAQLNNKFFANKDGDALQLGDLSSHAAYTSTKGFSLKENYEYLSDSYNKKWADTFGDDVVFDHAVNKGFYDETTTETGKAIEVRKGIRSGDENSAKIMAGLIKGSEKNTAMILKEINANRPEGDKITSLEGVETQRIAEVAADILDRVAPIQEKTVYSANVKEKAKYESELELGVRKEVERLRSALQLSNSVKLQGYERVGATLAQDPAYAALSFNEKREYIKNNLGVTDPDRINAMMSPVTPTKSDGSNYSETETRVARNMVGRFESNLTTIRDLKLGEEIVGGQKQKTLVAYGTKKQLLNSLGSWYNQAISSGMSESEAESQVDKAAGKISEGEAYLVLTPSVGEEKTSAPSIQILTKEQMGSKRGSQVIANFTEGQVGGTWNELTFQMLGYNPFENFSAPEPPQEVTKDETDGITGAGSGFDFKK